MDVWINITKNGIIDDVLEENKRLNEWIDRLSDTSKYRTRQTDRYNANCNTNWNEDRQTEEYKRRIKNIKTNKYLPVSNKETKSVLPILFCSS